jgi:hypothetical protein
MPDALGTDIMPISNGQLNDHANGVLNGAHVNGHTPEVSGADEDNGDNASSGTLIGRIGSPPRLESTSGEFHFWATRGQMVERTQIVQTRSTFGNGQTVDFYGIVEEVKRVSRKNDMAQEFDKRDGVANASTELKPEGITYATVSVLRSFTIKDNKRVSVLTPPLEESEVFLGDASTAAISYDFDGMARPLAIGRLCNGASGFAGTGKIDLYYLLGQISGHLNVSGMTGLGAKSSFLLTLLRLLLHEAAQLRHGQDQLHIVPVIFNVKGHDLMWIDKPNNRFDPEKHLADWNELGCEPGPFTDAQFYAPKSLSGSVATLYSWSLRDVLSLKLFPFLFEDDRVNDNMTGLVYDIVNFLTEPDGKTLRAGVPQTWGALKNWMWEQVGKKDKDDRDPSNERDIKLHVTGTWRAIGRRLWDILNDGETLFPRDAQNGSPLNIVRSQSAPPQVIDIAPLPTSLKRFVVAAVMKQVNDARLRPDAPHNLSFLVMLDELNRFAPRDSKDGITKLLEEIALEGRSRGVILLGAQQFASQVSAKIVESAAIRVCGRCGAGEMDDKVWKSWGDAAHEQASNLQLDEKLVMQPTFRAPMLVKMPHPAWAMRQSEIGTATPSVSPNGAATDANDSDDYLPQS